jgi:hypothetical protein
MHTTLIALIGLAGPGPAFDLQVSRRDIMEMTWSHAQVRSTPDGVLVQRIEGRRHDAYDIRRRRVSTAEVAALLAQLEALDWASLESAKFRIMDYSGTPVSITIDSRSNRFEGLVCPDGPVRPPSDTGCRQRSAAELIEVFVNTAGVPWVGESGATWVTDLSEAAEGLDPHFAGYDLRPVKGYQAGVSRCTEGKGAISCLRAGDVENPFRGVKLKRRLDSLELTPADAEAAKAVRKAIAANSNDAERLLDALSWRVQQRQALEKEGRRRASEPPSKEHIDMSSSSGGLISVPVKPKRP